MRAVDNLGAGCYKQVSGPQLALKPGLRGRLPVAFGYAKASLSGRRAVSDA